MMEQPNFDIHKYTEQLTDTPMLSVKSNTPPSIREAVQEFVNEFNFVQMMMMQTEGDSDD